MRSSSGLYFESLDHVRALAVFTVFTFHFMRFDDGNLKGPLAFPLSFFTEGHTGVAIFMVLSGYLFAKILNKKTIMYFAFLKNRIIRLLPLLIIVIIIFSALLAKNGQLTGAFLLSVVQGIVLPTIPNGGWSITVEFHFYLMLPLILLVARKSIFLLLVAVALLVLIRLGIFVAGGDVQYWGYWTIVGRADQFILGIFAFEARSFAKGRHLWAAWVALGFLIFWYVFDAYGGFFAMPAEAPFHRVWIVIPTIEGAAYAFLIAWYDFSFTQKTSPFFHFLAYIGERSYSIYLLHFFLVFRIPVFIDAHLFSLENRYVLLAMAPLAFLIMLPIAHLSYKYIELPALRFRTRYFTDSARRPELA